MFDLLFQDYKDKIYKPSLKHLTGFEKILIALIIIVSAIFCVCSFLNLGVIPLLINFVILLILMVGSYFYIQLYIKRNNLERITRYKERFIGLQELIKEKNYNLYNESGIDWLIECSKIKADSGSSRSLLSSLKNFFQVIIYTIITLTFGVIISNISYTDTIFYAISVVMMIGVLAIIVMGVQNLYEVLFENDKKICEYFLNDLAYLRTQMFPKRSSI